MNSLRSARTPLLAGLKILRLRRRETPKLALTGPLRTELYSLSNWYKLSVRSIHAMDVNGKLVAHTVEIGAATAAKQTAKH